MTAVQGPHDTAAAMEDIHGVDVSWLHHSTRDHHHRQQAPSSPGLTRDGPPKTSSHGGLPTRPLTDSHSQTNSPAGPASTTTTTTTTTTPMSAPAVYQPTSPTQQPAPVTSPPTTAATTPPLRIPSKRPQLLGRNSGEKVPGTSPSPESKNLSRRNSWISSISSKFSSQNPPAQTTHAQAQGSPVPNHGSSPTTSSANGALNGIQAASGGRQHGLEPYVPQQPKANFLSNALRRLSSGSQVGTSGKVYPNGGMCPRKVMNVDRNRPRCLVPELDENKLRKVAFCVDVEIASGPKYKDDAVAEDKKKKSKDKKLKERGEGEALKHPNAVAEEKEKQGTVSVAQEIVGTAENEPNPEGTIVDDEKKDTSKKKEKKKRSEAERKERKEKKRRKAEENGTIPIEFSRDDDEGSIEGSPPGPGVVPPKIQDRPTVDPLRIYRRCCQLRESPILKRISDQLSAPSSCSVNQPGVINCLDLTGSRLQLADVLTLSDWLAIVPVKKLFLEDADLNDDKVRVLLAGLLAAKQPDGYRRRAATLSSNSTDPSTEHHSNSVIKKLVLKNNPKITYEGWKHIALFIYMCKSIVALDISMIPFPRQRAHVSPSPANATNGTTPQKESPSRDIAEIFSKAIAERLGGSELQELSMGECALTAASIRKIVDGCIISGIQRLGLASNDIDNDGLEHVLHYIRSGVCKGIDLGGNELHDWIPRLCEGLDKENPLWALCLADTGLTPESLKLLFPTLVAMPDFRFLDLSHNKNLFSSPTSCCLLRKYMPLFKILKRLHLVDVDLKPADAIAIAEILPDCPHMAHINILENPEITRVATSTDEDSQEEAAALFASLTMATKLSRTIICVDIDVPAPELGEVVKALAKQVVAYCLRNIELINEVPELNAAPKEVELPHVLMHLVGHDDPYCPENDSVLPAPDEDYIVGGTGIAKALNYCLNHKATDIQRISVSASGASTPRSRAEHQEEPSKAKTMSKNLLNTARNTRARIQPALAREAKKSDDMQYRRLLFLDQTLEGMIQRFEDEYPETRLRPTSEVESMNSSNPSSSLPASTVPTLDNSITDITAVESDEEEPHFLRSRHNSDVSLASRHMSQEEGRLHRFGHRVRTGLLNPSRPSTSDGDESTPPNAFISGTMDDCGLPQHLVSLRHSFMALTGDEMRQKVEGLGWEKAFDSVVENAEELSKLEKEDPAAFKTFRESQIAALKNRNPDIHAPGESTDCNKSADADDCAVED